MTLKETPHHSNKDCKMYYKSVGHCFWGLHYVNFLAVQNCKQNHTYCIWRLNYCIYNIMKVFIKLLMKRKYFLLKMEKHRSQQNNFYKMKKDILSFSCFHSNKGMKLLLAFQQACLCWAEKKLHLLLPLHFCLSTHCFSMWNLQPCKWSYMGTVHVLSL